jgi:hypothetical protein
LWIIVHESTMSSSHHTYGPTCHLARTVSFSGVKTNDDIPALRAQFFYASPLPIDDPLTAVPPPTGDLRAAKHPPRPYSAYDNNALEEAWLGLTSPRDRKRHLKIRSTSPKPLTKAEAEKRAALVSEIAAKHNKKHAIEELSKRSSSPSKTCVICPSNDGSTPIEICCAELEKEIRAEQNRLFLGTWFRRGSKLEVDRLIQDIMVEERKQKAAKLEEKKLGPMRGPVQEIEQQKHEDHRHAKRSLRQETSDQNGSRSASPGRVTERPATVAKPAADDGSSLSASLPANAEAGTSGNPFQRAPSRSGSPTPVPKTPRPTPASPALEHNDAILDDQCQNETESANELVPETIETVRPHSCKSQRNRTNYAEIPVGICRLHLVKLPTLQMMPIYWSPVHDIAAVIRGTWFYRDSMYPVEPAVANQLEFGYRDLRPWSQTWADEVSSALSIGAEGEEKISHTLWPKEPAGKPEVFSMANHAALPTDPYCAARCFSGEVAAEGTVDPSNPEEKPPAATEVIKKYPNAQVFYKDSQNAYILKPSLQPSAYYGRKPIVKIKKGTTVGIHVVRGFDWSAWEKVHPVKKAASTLKAEVIAPATGDTNVGKRAVCDACQEAEKRPKVTDLVLVIHGIGQKLSERVESFHFTHAINSFRRAINVELVNESVQKILRPELGGIMVLPVNWRSNLSFEDGGPMKQSDKGKNLSPSDFSLKDITPDTIPAVRNLISDVMLDIPFYMSHHKPKMIEALIYEANRVYRLWCRNNPDFEKEGHVHIIAHSLGSAMALDVLSKQPTVLPHPDLNSKKIHNKYFDFDTKNLFFVGSPAGFFLLLNKGHLLPRKGRNKPGSIGVDKSHDITGEANTYGCLAVDNLYNIMV